MLHGHGIGNRSFGIARMARVGVDKLRRERSPAILFHRRGFVGSTWKLIELLPFTAGGMRESGWADLVHFSRRARRFRGRLDGWRGSADAACAPARAARPGEMARRRLEHRIGAHLPGRRLALAVTDNRYTMISVKREKGLYRLRLHHMFLEAEPEVVRALGRYVARQRSRRVDAARPLHRRQPAQDPPRAPHAAPHAVTLETRGEVHDLQEHLRRRSTAATSTTRSTRASPGASARRRAASGAAATRSRWAPTPSRIG